jgi:hypothetical protein
LGTGCLDRYGDTCYRERVFTDSPTEEPTTMTDTTRIEVTVTDRRNDQVVVRAEADFNTTTSFTDAIDFAHAAADGVVEREHRAISCMRVSWLRAAQ